MGPAIRALAGARKGIPHDTGLAAPAITLSLTPEAGPGPAEPASGPTVRDKVVDPAENWRRRGHGSIRGAGETGTLTEGASHVPTAP